MKGWKERRGDLESVRSWLERKREEKEKTREEREEEVKGARGKKNENTKDS